MPSFEGRIAPALGVFVAWLVLIGAVLLALPAQAFPSSAAASAAALCGESLLSQPVQFRSGSGWYRPPPVFRSSPVYRPPPIYRPPVARIPPRTPVVRPTIQRPVIRALAIAPRPIWQRSIGQIGQTPVLNRGRFGLAAQPIARTAFAPRSQTRTLLSLSARGQSGRIAASRLMPARNASTTGTAAGTAGNSGRLALVSMSSRVGTARSLSAPSGVPRGFEKASSGGGGLGGGSAALRLKSIFNRAAQGASPHRSSNDLPDRLAKIPQRISKVHNSLIGKHESDFTNEKYASRKLKTHEIFYRYHGIDNRTRNKVVYITKQKYSSEAELRQKLAIRKEWGDITNVSRIKVPAGAWISEGNAASQGSGYPGGGYQAVITNVPRGWIVDTKKAF